MQPATPGKGWGSGNYQLEEMDVYTVMSGGSEVNSFAASAKATDGFSVNIGCAKVAADANMNANATTVQSFDGATRTPSEEASSLSVSFLNGQLSSAQVSTQAASSVSGAGDERTSFDRQEITGDDGQTEYLSYRFYAPTANTVDMRFKMEATNLTEFVRFVFQAQ